MRIGYCGGLGKESATGITMLARTFLDMLSRAQHSKVPFSTDRPHVTKSIGSLLYVTTSAEYMIDCFCIYPSFPKKSTTPPRTDQIRRALPSDFLATWPPVQYLRRPTRRSIGPSPRSSNKRRSQRQGLYFALRTTPFRKPPTTDQGRRRPHGNHKNRRQTTGDQPQSGHSWRLMRSR